MGGTHQLPTTQGRAKRSHLPVSGGAGEGGHGDQGGRLQPPEAQRVQQEVPGELRQGTGRGGPVAGKRVLGGSERGSTGGLAPPAKNL